MTHVREMAIVELPRIGEIDRSEHIEQQYRSRDGSLDLIDVDIRAPRWDEPGERTVQEYADSWRTLLERGGVLLGAFDGERLVGIAIYDRAFPGEPARCAVPYEAPCLYVSATPTRGTVDFYLSEGFDVLATPIEPEDIHLALTL